MQLKSDHNITALFFTLSNFLLQILFFQLIERFIQYVQADPPTNKSLAALVVQLLQFQEDNLSKNATKPALTRIPVIIPCIKKVSPFSKYNLITQVKCFMDFKPNGGLCHIMATAYRYRSEQNWRRFDLASPSRLDRNTDMFVAMERTLVQNKCYIIPVVFARTDIDKTVVTKAKEIVKRHNGIWTEVENEATHILYPPCDPLEEEYARPTMRRDKNIMFHWYYFPDSYDTWVNTEMSLSDVPENPVTHNGLWRVSITWVLDTEQYNEWMTEEDYEVDESGNKKVNCSKFISLLHTYN